MAEMTTIKALAQEQHCTYQAIWKLVTKYEKDLGNHVVKKGRDRFLDDFAVDFILEKRKDHPMVALNVDQSAIIESQKQEIEKLQSRIFDLQNKVMELQSEQQKMIEYKLQTTFLLENNQKLKEESDQLKEENKSLTKAGIENEFLHQKINEQSDALKLVHAELESFQPSLFGFYRKKKKQ